MPGQVFSRVIGKPDFPLFVLPNSHFLWRIDGVGPSLPQERGAALWSPEQHCGVWPELDAILCGCCRMVDSTKHDLAFCFNRGLKSLDCLLHRIAARLSDQT